MMKKQRSKDTCTQSIWQNLTEIAKRDEVVGRESEIRRVTEVLCRRTKNNPVLIGEAGVGKTAIVEGLAQQFFWYGSENLLDKK